MGFDPHGHGIWVFTALGTGLDTHLNHSLIELCSIASAFWDMARRGLMVDILRSLGEEVLLVGLAMGLGVGVSFDHCSLLNADIKRCT